MAEEDIYIAFIIFGSIVGIVWLALHFRTQKARLLADGGGDYKRLAEEAVRGQQVLLEEVRAMNVHLREIEKLLREV